MKQNTTKDETLVYGDPFHLKKKRNQTELFVYELRTPSLPPEEESMPVGSHRKAGIPLGAGSHHKESSDPSLITTLIKTQINHYLNFRAHFCQRTQQTYNVVLR